MNGGHHWTDLLDAIATALNENRERLDALDATVGDGEHGTNISKAFTELASQVRATAQEGPPGAVIKKAGLILLNVGGSAATTFYGLSLVAAGSAAAGAESLDADTVARMFRAAVDKITEKGKAKVGDKTLIDCLEPACAALEGVAAAGLGLAGCLAAAVKAGEAGTARTKDMIGSRGRALYSGERSLGFEDPGASSALIMLKTLAGFVASEEE